MVLVTYILTVPADTPKNKPTQGIDAPFPLIPKEYKVTAKWCDTGAFCNFFGGELTTTSF
jgi:hypothetical protein